MDGGIGVEMGDTATGRLETDGDSSILMIIGVETFGGDKGSGMSAGVITGGAGMSSDGEGTLGPGHTSSSISYTGVLPRSDSPGKRWLRSGEASTLLLRFICAASRSFFLSSVSDISGRLGL